MSKPHKHAELIKAWADGDEIQCFKNGEWVDCVSNDLVWNENASYRIKPKPDVVKVIHFDNDLRGSENIYVSTHSHNLHTHWKNHVQITFDGETGKLKSAEVINYD